MAEPQEINPYQAPEQVGPAPKGVPDKRIDYPGGLRTVGAIGLVAGLFVGVAIFSGFGGFLFGLLVYVAAFVWTGMLLPHSTSELPVRIIGSIMLSVAMVVLYVPTCGFSMVITMTVFSGEPIALIISSMMAMTVTLMLGAMRIRSLVRRRRAIMPTHTDGGITVDVPPGDPGQPPKENL